MRLSDDELRSRLRGLDPARRPSRPVGEDPVTVPPPRPGRATSRRRVGALSAAAVIVLTVVVALVLTRGQTGDDQAAERILTLTTAPPSPTMASCLPVTSEALREMPVAFEGTVTERTAESVLLSVDRWYQGGSASAVRLTTPAATQSIALDGVELRAGSTYLVTATNGTVNGCGFSGLGTPELEGLYRQAFGG